MITSFFRAAALAACLVSPLAGAAGTLSGAGSTAAAKLYDAWAGDWARKSGTALEYSALGSSAGLREIRARKTDFGASDVAPPAAELERDGLIAFPTAISGVVPVVNLPGLGKNKLRLTGPLLGALLSGRISQWNAPELRKLNPGIDLPALPVIPVVREDGSGTTYILSHYLCKVSPEWKAALGNDFKLKWPEVAQQVKGGGKVVEAVKARSGTIGYVEYGQALEAELATVQLQNHAARWVSAEAASFNAALKGSAWTSRGAFEEMLTDTAEPEGWPITGGTFIVMHKVQANPARAAQVLSFFTWGFMHGDAQAAALRWIPLPTLTQARVVKEMARLQDRNGQAIPFAFAP